jgi:hypothetical protein
VTVREARLGEVVGAVVRQALHDHGARRVALLDDGSPEAALCARLLAPLGEAALLRVRAEGAEVEPLLHSLAAAHGRERAARELARVRARLEPDALPASPENKTALLLGGALPPEPLLPLGDLWASEVEALCGEWSGPPEARRLAEAAGGISALDAALRACVDRRDPAGLEMLPPEVEAEARRLLARGRASRLFPRLVPKLGTRTLGVDLFE